METANTRNLTTSGSLAEFRLTDVLQTLGLGRQYLQIEVHDPESNHVGLIGVKAGHVVDARRGGLSGKAAFAALCRLPGEGFFRITKVDAAGIPEPIGRLQDLLLEILCDEERPDPPASEPRPGAPPDPRANEGKPPPTRGPLAARRAGSEGCPPPAVSIAVVSPKGGVGKTTLAVNLASALAAPRRTVVLVDGSINGDVLAALAAQHRARAGVVEVITGESSLDTALLPTANPHLRILAAFGPGVAVPERAAEAGAEAWRRLIAQAADRADVVLVDTPAGLFGATQSIMRGVTHVLGVLQAEPMASRLSDRFDRVIASFPGLRPALVGVVLNMLQANCETSTEVLRDLGRSGRPPLFQSYLPRSAEFLKASREGQPVQFLGESPVAALFSAIAAELADRLNLSRTEGPRMRFLA